MRIGFTGTRKGMTEYQKQEVERLLRLYRLVIIEAHHGDCIGSDQDFHQICLGLNIPIDIHPSDMSYQRAYCSGARYIYAEKPPLERNRDIVNLVDMVIVCPKSNKEEIRSGTWMTVRYCRKVGRVVRIIYP